MVCCSLYLHAQHPYPGKSICLLPSKRPHGKDSRRKKASRIRSAARVKWYTTRRPVNGFRNGATRAGTRMGKAIGSSRWMRRRKGRPRIRMMGAQFGAWEKGIAWTELEETKGSTVQMTERIERVVHEFNRNRLGRFILQLDYSAGGSSGETPFHPNTTLPHSRFQITSILCMM